MGQYHIIVNLDKKEALTPFSFGDGFKAWEIIANAGSAVALAILLFHPEARGGGDLDNRLNWHGPERNMKEHACKPADMPEQYEAVAAEYIGRWRGDRIAIIGDYAENGDLDGTASAEINPETIFQHAYDQTDGWVNISPQVRQIMNHELHQLHTYQPSHYLSDEEKRDPFCYHERVEAQEVSRQTA